MPQVNLGQAEWEILQYVGEHHPVTVREVADHMADNKGLARTTVLTVMERLRAKGFLVRRKQNDIYRYSPKKSLAELTQGLVQSFVDNMLNGTLSRFLLTCPVRTRSAMSSSENSRSWSGIWSRIAARQRNDRLGH